MVERRYNRKQGLETLFSFMRVSDLIMGEPQWEIASWKIQTQRGDLLYEPQPRQSRFHSCPVQCKLYGGAAGGGKTEAILWEIYGLCNTYKNLKGAVFRKTFPEIDKYFIQRALDKFPRGSYKYSKKDHVMTFTRTNSQVQFNYCDGDHDLPRYQGAEWDFLAIDELTHFTEYQFKYLFTRMRTNKQEWVPRFFAGTNPGGVGHSFCKRIFVDGDLNDQEKRFEWAYIPATLDDNPRMLDINPDYENQLMLLPDEQMAKALRYGDWNIFAGQFFTQLRYHVHAFQPFEIPSHWKRFIAVDYGFDHPAVALWFAIDDAGEIWIYKELGMRQKTYREFTKEIISMIEPDEKIEYIVADPAIWAKKGQGMSGAEEMQEEMDFLNIMIIKADNDRVNGWGVTREWMKVYESSDPSTKKRIEKTRFHVSTALKGWWKTVPEQQYNSHKPEDMLKQDGDDWADATRYGLMSRPHPNKKKTIDNDEPERDRYGEIIKKKKTTRPQWKPEPNRITWKPKIS